MSKPESRPTGTFARLRKEGNWGCKIEEEIAPGTTTEVDVRRKDGTSETKTVTVFWAGDGISLGNFVDS